MEVAVSELRANLRDWLERAREGDEVVVTERGIPVARLLGIDAAPLLDRLTAEGLIGRPATAERPAVSSRLAYPEVRAALAAAHRNHDLDGDGLAQAEASWAEFWGQPDRSS
ncbi:MAG TPA: type II toxin-antitoxin system prevent-host-death family antitoxin [Acidimicrobiales bacterium]|jgi:prevent-host-death family protein|nr:type II toxin-antitoxin system prevent-host-death family antitoxin [Acidimicrobiales bacterium]